MLTQFFKNPVLSIQSSMVPELNIIGTRCKTFLNELLNGIVRQQLLSMSRQGKSREGWWTYVVFHIQISHLILTSAFDF